MSLKIRRKMHAILFPNITSSSGNSLPWKLYCLICEVEAYEQTRELVYVWKTFYSFIQICNPVRSGFLSCGCIGILGWIILCIIKDYTKNQGGGILCIAGCLEASLAPPTRCQRPSPSLPNQSWQSEMSQTLLAVLEQWRAKSPQLAQR